MVGKQGEWSPNHLFDSERLQPPPPILANASKTTCFALWDETERREGKPPTVVGKQGEWLENHSFDPGKRPPFHPPLMISSKITRVTFPDGNRHPSILPVPSGTYVGPTVLPTRSDVTETMMKRSEKDEIDENRCPLGVLVKTELLGLQKPRFVVEQDHSPTDETPQGSPPPFTLPLNLDTKGRTFMRPGYHSGPHYVEFRRVAVPFPLRRAQHNELRQLHTS